MKVLDAQGLERRFEVLEPNEHEYWLRMAALLDPAAFVLQTGAAWNVTVPDGETWHSVNMWNARLGATGGTLWQRRVAKLWDALALSQGTNVQSNGSAQAFVYYCRPSLVSSDAKYRDPRGLFFERMARLRTLPVYSANLSIAAGNAVANNVATHEFPTDFANGIITLAHIMDGAWVITSDVTGTAGYANLSDEISDAHAVRFAESMLFPFQRAVMPAITVHAGNQDGAGGLSLAGNGGVLYHKLPADW